MENKKRIFVVEIRGTIVAEGKLYRRAILADNKEAAEEEVIDMFNDDTTYTYLEDKYSIESYDLSTKTGRMAYDRCDFEKYSDRIGKDEDHIPYVVDCGWECWSCPWFNDCDCSTYGM